jgi:Tol biopolymer transport system component
MECDVSLVPGDRYGTDIYLRDRVARTTRLVSVSDHGWSVHEGTDASISADGRYVCFTAMDAQLSRRDHNFRSDVYVRDRRTRETLLISEGAGGKRAQFGRFGVISDNGRFVAFNTPAALVPGDTNNLSDVYVRDLETWGVVRASLSDADQQTLGAGSRIPQISANGRFVTFRSAAPGLAPGDTRREEDVFIRDLTERTTRRVSMSINGGAGNAISFTGPVSANGRVVAFTSYASNLVADDLDPSELDVFLWRRR